MTTTQQHPTVERRAINPWTWQDGFGYSQAIHLRNVTDTLVLSGQAAMSAEGVPLHEGDMAAQLARTFENIETVLSQAGFELAAIDRLDALTTDVDELLVAWPAVAQRLVAIGCRPAVTLIGVERLAFPELLVEVVATAHR